MAAVGDNPQPNAWRLRLLVAICSALFVYGLIVSGLPHYQHLSHGARLLRLIGPLSVALAATYAAAGWWAARSWQILWRRGRDRWQRIVFDRGVRLVGLPIALCCTVSLTWLGWRIGASEPRVLAAGLITGVVVGVPVGLHLGYLCGLVFARVSGIGETPSAVVARVPANRSESSEPSPNSSINDRWIAIRWQQSLPRWARAACIACGSLSFGATAALMPSAFPVGLLGLFCVLVGWKGVPLFASVRYATENKGARVREGIKTIQRRGWLVIAVAVTAPAFPAGLMAILPAAAMPTLFFLSALPALACALGFVLSACPRCDQHFFVSSQIRRPLNRCQHCSLPLKVVNAVPNPRPKRRDK